MIQAKTFLFIAALCLLSYALPAQDVPPPVLEQQLENIAAITEGEMEDDSYVQQLEQFRRRPLRLNEADEEDLQQLRMLTPLQISHFLRYRRLTGNIIDLYELQAIPHWDVHTIRKLMPYISVATAQPVSKELAGRLKEGAHQLLFRYAQVLEKAKGYSTDNGAPAYTGTPQRYFFRYRYQHKNNLQWGLLADKDAGEPFFKSPVKPGFDFYSAHVFIRRLGIIKALALGDFTVNMGQGLVIWQSLAFGKSADISGIKRQSAVLRPYSAAGEYNFQRGVGMTIGKGKTELTVFASQRRLSASTAMDATGDEYVTSIKTSGYHRTLAEQEDRNILRQIAAGGSIRYKTVNWSVGVNSVLYRFDKPIHKRPELYNLYAISGDKWQNHSIDYSYTFRNLHLFGEFAMTGRGDKALVTGLLAGAGKKADFSLFYRNISPGYQALQGNAFTENSMPANERGIYTGLHIRPSASFRIQAYTDICHFPWLKYLVSAPSYSRDYQVQLTYTPARETELYMRFRHEAKDANRPGEAPLPVLQEQLRQNIRIHMSSRVNADIVVRGRAEAVSVKTLNAFTEYGYLVYADIIYNRRDKLYSITLRPQFFDTDSYQSRIYVYENDVLYSYSIPAFFGRGFRYYCLLSYRLSKGITCWLRWAQSIFYNQMTIGSGNDEIRGNRKSEVKFQLRWAF